MSKKSVSSKMVLVALFSMLFLTIAGTASPPLSRAEVPDSKLVFSRSESLDNSLRSFRMAPEAKTEIQNFFDRYREEFNLGQKDAMVEVHSESKKGIHVFQQMHDGLEVLGAGYTIWEKDNAVTSGIGKLAPDLQLDTKPDLSENQAREIIRNRVAPRVLHAEIPTPQLLIVPVRPDGEFESGQVKLAYYYGNIELRDPACEKDTQSTPCQFIPTRYFYLDAESGEILFEGENIDRAYENVTLSSPLKNYYDQDVLIHTKKEVGKENYVLGLLPEDGFPGITLRCWAPSSINFWSIDKGELMDSNLNDQDNFNNTDCKNGKVGVSIMDNMERILDYLSNNFAWIGYDGYGQIPLEVGIFFMPFSPFYDLQTTRMGIPLFSNILVSSSGYQYKFSVDLEIMAHEFMHGISHAMFNPGKAFPEMAAINESISDIFALVMKNKVEPSAQWDWEAGKGAVHAAPPGYPKTLRLFSNPKLINHPMTYDPTLFHGTTPKPDPHNNGEISNYWFYLLSEGSKGEKTNDKGQKYNVFPIGVDNAMKILFRTVTGRYLHSADGYMQLRFATLMATEDLISEGKLGLQGNQALISVMNAWHAVGVGDSFDAVKKTSPYNGQPEIYPWPVQLRWQIAYPHFEKKWQVRISNNPDFRDTGMTNRLQNFVYTSEPVSATGLGFTNLSTAFASFSAEPGATYYWQVRTLEIDEVRCENYAKNLGRSGQKLCEGILNSWSKANAFQTSDIEPTPIAPDASLKEWPWPVKFSWQEVEGATGYVLQLAEQPFSPEQNQVKKELIEDENAKFFNIFQLASSSGTQTLERTLKIDASYYWRVAALGPSVGFWQPGIQPDHHKYTKSSWSNGGQGINFETALPKTEISEPSGYKTLHPWNFHVAWKRVEGAEDFETVLGRDAFFMDEIPEQHIKKNNVTETSEQLSLPPALDQQPLWLKLIPIGPAPYHERGESTIANFKIDYGVTEPQLFEPIQDAEIVHGDDVNFRWSDIDEAAKYHLLLEEGTNPPDPQNYLVANDNTLRVDAGAASSHEGGYCWSVQSIGPGNFPGLTAEPQCYKVGPTASSIVRPSHKETIFNVKPFEFIWRNDFAPHGFVIRLKKQVGNNYTTILDDLNIGQAEPAVGGGYRYVFNNIEPNAHYHWRIGTKKENGQVKWFPPLDQGGYEFITRPVLESPKITSIVPAETSAKIIWNDSNPYQLSHKLVIYGGTSQPLHLNIPETGQYTVTGLTAGTHYEAVLYSIFKNNLKFNDGTVAYNSDTFSHPSTVFTTLQSSPSGPLTFVLNEGTLSDFDLKVWDPNGFLVATDTYADNVEQYYIENHKSQTAGPDRIQFPYPVSGNYCVRVLVEYGTNQPTSFSLDVYRGNKHVKTLVLNQPVSAQENNGGAGKYWPSASTCYIYTNN